MMVIFGSDPIGITTVDHTASPKIENTCNIIFFKFQKGKKIYLIHCSNIFDAPPWFTLKLIVLSFYMGKKECIPI